MARAEAKAGSGPKFVAGARADPKPELEPEPDSKPEQQLHILDYNVQKFILNYLRFKFLDFLMYNYKFCSIFRN